MTAALVRFAGEWMEWECPGCGCLVTARIAPGIASSFCASCVRPKRLRRPDEASTRQLCASSWSAARRAANEDGLLQTPASCAGHYLELADGDAARALAALVEREGPFWGLVAQHLARIVAEES